MLPKKIKKKGESLYTSSNYYSINKVTTKLQFYTVNILFSRLPPCLKLLPIPPLSVLGLLIRVPPIIWCLPFHILLQLRQLYPNMSNCQTAILLKLHTQVLLEFLQPLSWPMYYMFHHCLSIWFLPVNWSKLYTVVWYF